MALRVYDLAKEQKISSAALMTYLKDMGIEIKSHMKYLDDDIVEKVRKRIQDEKDYLKKQADERKIVQQQLRDKEKSKKEQPQIKSDNPFANLKVPERKAKPKTSTEQQETINPFEKKQKTEKPKTIPVKEAIIPEPKEIPEQKETIITEPEQPKKHIYTEKTHTPEKQVWVDKTPKQTENRNRQHQQYQNQRYDKNRNQQQGTSQHRQRRDQNQEQTNQNERPPRRQYPDRIGRTDRNERNDRFDRNDRPNRENRDNRDNRDNRQDRQNRDNRQDRPDRRNFDRDRRDDRPNRDHRDNRNQTGRPYNQSKQTPSSVTFPKAGIIKPVGVANFDDKVFGKKKTNMDDLGDKSKHLLAKIQNTKKRKNTETQPEIDEVTLERNIKMTLQGNKKKKKYKKEEKVANVIEEINEIKISEFTSVSELAKIIDVSPSEIITKFFMMGKMVTINTRLDKDSLELICTEYELNVHFRDEFGTDIIQNTIDDIGDIDERFRPPVVTIMGHVDHGKTSILDMIRNTKVVAGESGGITQHIGAYQATHNGQKITFIDTPGHEAFTAMRARGANITDVVVIVVAANDGVKPQTIEAIDHSKIAGVTMVIAINKIDLPEANMDKTIASLLEQNVYLEGYGGKIPWVKCSAITGEGIDELLEIILLSAEMKEIKARFNGPGKGIVIESEKNTKMGSKATILLQEGCLHKGDNIVVGSCFGHVRKMENELAKELTSISPSDIAVIFGLNDVPKAGDKLNVVENEKTARQIGGERLLIRQEREKFRGTTNLGNLFTKIKQNEMSELRLIIKADVDGSVEAICDSLQKLSTEEININIIRKSVGGIIEADVNLAIASDAIIIGFNVRANNKAKKLAEDSDIEIKFYTIIFEAIDDIKKAMLGMLSPEYKEKILGAAVVKQVFKIKKIGTIAGCAVDKGVIQSKSKIRLFRNDKLIYTGEMDKLKHYNDEVSEAKSGTECGITIKNYTEIKENDVIECFIMEEIARQL